MSVVQKIGETVIFSRPYFISLLSGQEYFLAGEDESKLGEIWQRADGNQVSVPITPKVSYTENDLIQLGLLTAVNKYIKDHK